jgi:hypothetical protein
MFESAHKRARALRARRSLRLALAAAAFACLAAPASALGGAVITPVPTFPYPSVMVGEPFNASITFFNTSTGPEAAAGTTVTASDLTLFPSCPDSVITANDCPNVESGVFKLSTTGTSGAGHCPPGTWTITEATAGRFGFAPPSAIGLLPFESCTVEFTGTALKLPQFDAALAMPGVQTNQVAAISAFSPVTGLTVRNSGTGTTSVLSPLTPLQGGGRGNNPGAKLKVSEGCPRIVKATVTGSGVQSVSFFVDGKKYGPPVNRAPFTKTINAVKFPAGRHKLRAEVKFTASSGKLAGGLAGGFLRCKPRPTPNYTG